MQGKPSPEHTLLQMESILKELVAIAEKLQEVSQQIIAKEELRPLQDKQKALINQLVEADSAYNTACKGKPNDYHSPTRKSIAKMLEHFQTLNSSFIDNLTKSKGVIPLELQHIPKS